MKLILTQEVSGLGAPGDVVEVKDGYGRNYLIPRGLGLRWTRGGERQIDQIKRARSAKEIRSLEHAQEVQAQLGTLTVSLPARAGETGKLFGSITTSDIARAIKTAGGPDLDKRTITLRGAVKTVGRHQVSVHLHPDVTASVAVDVVAAD
jgi:large subunit ribosomal protein L9